MRKITFLLTAFCFFNVISFAQTTEVFETETVGSTTFTDNSQNFTISSTIGDTYNIATGVSYGWNGTANDDRYIDNTSGMNGTGDGSSLTIKTTDGKDIKVIELYIYAAKVGYQNVTGESLTITAKKDNNLVASYTILKNSFTSIFPEGANNGYTKIDFTTDGTSGVTNLSNTSIDELIFTTTGNFDYIGLDAFKWQALTAPVVTTTTASAVANTSATLAGNVTADGGDTVTENGIVYSTSDTTPTIAEGATKDTNGTGTGVFTEAITGLSVGTQYYFNTYAINSVGTSYGTASTFTTTGKGWTGATDTNWATASNWSPNSTPIASDNIIIPNVSNKPIISSSTAAVANDITIDASSSLTVESGGSLIIEGTASGNITYNRTLTANAAPLKAWHLLSSPVTGQTVANFIGSNTLANGTSNTNFRGIANYKIDGAGWNYYLVSYAGADVFDSGKGYSVKNATAGNVSFTGTYTSGNIDYSINQTTNNFNLTGNPFAAYINLGTFFTDNNAANRLSEQTIWLWDSSSDSYEQKMFGTDAAFEIAPGQAFFVSSGSAVSNKVTFMATNQSHKTDSFLRTTARSEVHINVLQDNLQHQTKLYYIDGTSTDFDNGFDGSMFGGVSYDLAVFSELVSNNKGKKLGIQSLPNSDYENMIVPLGLKAIAGKEITFTAEAVNLPSGIKIFLEDRIINTFTRLDEANSNYKITPSENLSGIGRFYLHTTNSALSVDNNVALDNVSIYKLDKSTLRIVGLSQEKTSVSIFNLLGKQVLNTSFTSNGVKDINLPNLSKGVYLVQLKNNSGKLNKKIILE